MGISMTSDLFTRAYLDKGTVLLQEKDKMGMEVYIYNTSAQEAEAGVLHVLEP